MLSFTKSPQIPSSTLNQPRSRTQLLSLLTLSINFSGASLAGSLSCAFVAPQHFSGIATSFIGAPLPSTSLTGAKSKMNSAAASSVSTTLRRSSKLVKSRYFSLQRDGDGSKSEIKRSSRSTLIASLPLVADLPSRVICNGQKESPESTSNLKESARLKSPPRYKNKRKDSVQAPKKNKKTKTNNIIERTRSFEPAWWGNVLTTNPNEAHPHVSSTLTPGKKQHSTNKNAENLHNSYPPVHTLILGTHPSIASLSQNQYYGHPLNAFWYIAGDALGFRRCSATSPSTGKPYVYFHDYLRHTSEEILEYPQQLERLVAKGFALWDIVRECEREGSLDEKIEEEVANPIREFCEGTLIAACSGSVRRIVIANGTTGTWICY